MGIIDALVSFVRRNPLTCLLIVMLALLAPQVLGGIVRFVLYFILGLIILLFIALLVFRVRIINMAKRMDAQMRDAQFRGQAGDQSEEGDVKVYKTRRTEEKKVSKSVGDYVDFEEIEDKKEPEK